MKNVDAVATLRSAKGRDVARDVMPEVINTARRVAPVVKLPSLPDVSSERWRWR